MEITEIRVTLSNEDKLKAFVNVTFDNQFVVRGLKIINGKAGYFVSMPSRRVPHGKYQDIAHPINSEARHVPRSQGAGGLRRGAAGVGGGSTAG